MVIDDEEFHTGLVGVFGREQGEEHDAKIEKQTPVLDVIEIIGQSINQRGVASESVDGGPAGDAGFDRGAEVVMADGVFEVFDIFGSFRAGSDQAHLADQDVPELGKFVEVPLAEKFADPQSAGVILDGPAGGGSFFGIETHAAEFEDGEGEVVAAEAGLAVEDGSRGFAVDEVGAHGHDGGEEDEADDGAEDVDETFQDAVVGEVEGKDRNAEDGNAGDLAHGESGGPDIEGTGDETAGDVIAGGGFEKALLE